MLEFKGTYTHDTNGSRRENVIFDSKPIDIYIILIRKKALSNDTKTNFFGEKNSDSILDRMIKNPWNIKIIVNELKLVPIGCKFFCDDEIYNCVPW